MQCHHGIDAVGRRECLHVFAGGRVNGVVPSVAVTHGGFDDLSYSVVDLITADVHCAIQSRVAVEVEVTDCCCGVTCIDAGGGELQLEIPVGRVDEAHVVLCGVGSIVIMGEVNVARAVITALHGAVGAVVIIARSIAETVGYVGAPNVTPEQAVGERSGTVIVVNTATVTCRRVAHQVTVDVFVGVRVEEYATAKL